MSQNNVINSPKPTTIANGGTGQTTATAAVDVLITGASLTAVTPVSDDKVIYQDTSDSNHPKTATPVEIANLANALPASAITSGTLVHERGGLEADVSAYDGFIRIASGTTTNIKSTFSASSAPTTGDDSGDGYVVGSRWIDTTNDKEYVCLDNSLGAAVWTETTSGGASGAPADAQYLTLATNGTLTNERVFTPGTGFDIVDGGAGSTLTLDFDPSEFTEDTTPNRVGDFIITSDISASGGPKKALPQNILGGVLYNSQSLSAQAALLVNGFSSTFRRYVVMFEDCTPATDSTNMYIRIETGGSSIQSGATAYDWVVNGVSVNGRMDSGDPSAAQILVCPSAFKFGNSTGEGSNGHIIICNPSQTSIYHYIYGEVVAALDDGTIYRGTFGGRYLATTAVTGVQVSFSTGNITIKSETWAYTS